MSAKKQLKIELLLGKLFIVGKAEDHGSLSVFRKELGKAAVYALQYQLRRVFRYPLLCRLFGQAQIKIIRKGLHQ